MPENLCRTFELWLICFEPAGVVIRHQTCHINLVVENVILHIIAADYFPVLFAGGIFADFNLPGRQLANGRICRVHQGYAPINISNQPRYVIEAGDAVRPAGVKHREIIAECFPAVAGAQAVE